MNISTVQKHQFTATLSTGQIQIKVLTTLHHLNKDIDADIVLLVSINIQNIAINSLSYIGLMIF